MKGVLTDDANRLPKIILLSIIILASLLFNSRIVVSSDEDTINVLLLYSYNIEGKGSPKFDQGVRSGFAGAPELTINFSTEYMDLIRFKGEKYERQLYDLYITKYKNLKIDVIITYAYPALSFLLKYGDKIFPGTPVIFGLVSESAIREHQFPDNYTAIISGPQFATTVKSALQMLPETKEILVVGGTSTVDQQYLSTARTHLEPFQSKVDIRYENNLAMEDLLKVVAEQPKNSIIIYSLLQQDGRGKVFGPKGVARRISEASSVPVFGISQTHIGTGIVGGELNSVFLIGKKCATATLEVLKKVKPQPFKAVSGGTHSYDFDWRQLKRWKIQEAELPTGSNILYKKLSIWEQYYKIIIGLIAVFLFETILVAYLLINRSTRIKSEKLLKDSEEKFKSIFESANVAKSVTLPTGEITVNQAFADLLGYKNEELANTKWQEITPQDEIEGIQDRLVPILNGEINSTRFTKRYIHKNGSYVWGDVSVALKRDAANRPLFYITTIVDITELKTAVKNLTETEFRYQELFENMTAGFVLFEVVQDNNGLPIDLIVLAANKLFEKTTGVKTEDAIGKHLTSILPGIEDDEGDWIGIYGTVALTGESRQFEQGSDLLGYYYSIVAYRAGKNQCAVTFSDITDRKNAQAESEKLQAQLQQAQKMEAIGTLAGGVAHDYNNMLSVIIGFTELVLESTESSDQRIHEDLTEVLDAAKRSMDITRQLLAFARKQTIEPLALNLNDTIEEMLKMIRRLIGEDIDLTWLPDGDLWLVNMDPSQIDQILVNLCVNARDAITDTGKVTIETNNISLDAAYCSEHIGFIPGNFVLLAVSDNGAGMTREITDKIFEPFFTTKAKGVGTGLGLATIFGIVKQNNGFINVYSEPGEGTTFKIYLPRHEGVVHETKEGTKMPIPVSRGETILVVEDEDSILHLCERILTNLGYSLITTNSPTEAIAIAKEVDTQVSLLITDVIMPEMNGRTLADRLQTVFPNLKVLYMSGYTANVIAHHGVLDKDIQFVPKPLSRQALAVKVRETLDENLQVV